MSKLKLTAIAIASLFAIHSHAATMVAFGSSVDARIVSGHVDTTTRFHRCQLRPSAWYPVALGIGKSK